jgi:diguanylate cyclase (GGDEF)-like protein
MSLAQKYLSIAIKENKDFSLLVMDLDNFKIVNDTFGHGAGDEVIRVMGRLIKTYFRKNDIAGRIGGDEFVVVLKDASLEEAKKKAELFREVIADRKIIYEEQEISITVSIGVAAIHNAAKNIYNIGDILKMADNALYNAKAKGRNSVATFKS